MQCKFLDYGPVNYLSGSFRYDNVMAPDQKRYAWFPANLLLALTMLLKIFPIYWNFHAGACGDYAVQFANWHTAPMILWLAAGTHLDD